MTTVAKEPKKRSAALDGLRGLAILGVMLHHFGIHPSGWYDWGPIAPSIFFALSGFLIMGSLERMRDQGVGGAKGLLGFHLKRFARLVPALYLMLAVGLLLGQPYFAETWLWHATFLSNIKMVLANEWPGTLSQLWSLAIQEQFYVICPLVLFLPRRWIVPALFAVCAGALAFRLVALFCGWPEMTRWLLLPASLDTFAGGMLIAIWHKRKPLIAWLGSWQGFALAFVCIAISRVLRHGENTDWMWIIAFVEVFETVAICWMVLFFVQFPANLVTRFFAWFPLAGIGRISYGVFVWHMLVGVYISMALDIIGITALSAPLLFYSLMVAATLIVADLSWNFFERPTINAVAALVARKNAAK